MPSGRTHDIVTYALIPPTFLAAQWYWGDSLVSSVATAAMVFAGLMFGPDLDLYSNQYKRWGLLRFIWHPYMRALSHRSRFSHGLLFSTPIRVLYFLVMVALISTVALYLRQRYLFGAQTTWGAEFVHVSNNLVSLWKGTDKDYFKAGFIGLWVGAAAHTVTDIIGSMTKMIWKSF